MSTNTTYTEACAAAATAQGLDALTEALTAAGVRFTVDQTGGFAMVINVPLTDDPCGPWIGATASDITEGAYLVISYPDDIDPDEYDVLGESMTVADAVAVMWSNQAPQGTYHQALAQIGRMVAEVARYVATPCNGDGEACTNPQHDHVDYVDAEGNDAPAHPMVCNDCGVPTHYDRGAEQYRHDSPDAECFLTMPGVR